MKVAWLGLKEKKGLCDDQKILFLLGEKNGFKPHSTGSVYGLLVWGLPNSSFNKDFVNGSDMATVN